MATPDMSARELVEIGRHLHAEDSSAFPTARAIRDVVVERGDKLSSGRATLAAIAVQVERGINTHESYKLPEDFREVIKLPAPTVAPAFDDVRGLPQGALKHLQLAAVVLGVESEKEWNAIRKLRAEESERWAGETEALKALMIDLAKELDEIRASGETAARLHAAATQTLNGEVIRLQLQADMQVRELENATNAHDREMTNARRNYDETLRDVRQERDDARADLAEERNRCRTAEQEVAALKVRVDGLLDEKTRLVSELQTRDGKKAAQGGGRKAAA